MINFGAFLAQRGITAALFLVAIAFVLFVHGAVPFYAAPTLGQALWIAGFGYSFVQDSVLSIHANHFGWPAPAPIAFGLTGAYPVGLLIAAGFNALDAYSAVVGLWLTVASYGAWKLSRQVGVGPKLSILTALVWMTMPALWAHSGYSMVSIGMALMPFYLWVALRAVLYVPSCRISAALVAAGHLATCVISVFTDGYTFVMFAIGAGTISMVGWIRGLPTRRHYFFVFPLQAFSFGLAYLFYKAYFETVDDALSPMDFFRGWGVDITFLLVPTRGMLWLWDTLRLSVARSDAEFFGDGSVWATTFALPLVVAGLVGWWASRSKAWFTAAFLFAGLFGFYMALGPSLKVNSTKPVDHTSALMPEMLAVAPTGSEIISANIPGFQSMRASYRWSVLGFVCFWVLTLMLAVGPNSGRRQVLASIWISLLVLLNLPNLSAKWSEYKSYREGFFVLENGVIGEVDSDFEAGEIVAFLPYRNDFLANYLAPRTNIRTYNTGGDKNLYFARQHWPIMMRELGLGVIGPDLGGKVLEILEQNEADAVVLPYFDLLRAAHDGKVTNVYEDSLRPVVDELKRAEDADVLERESYAIVRKKSRSHPSVISSR
ncbi:MAG TPA: hypothetical protein VNS34_11250 [Rhizobiaceae bacterium]|nr:hypothetical protein [Rhizobiaceae bacterium]